jgi:hypothetical protein
MTSRVNASAADAPNMLGRCPGLDTPKCSGTKMNVKKQRLDETRKSHFSFKG